MNVYKTARHMSTQLIDFNAIGNHVRSITREDIYSMDESSLLELVKMIKSEHKRLNMELKKAKQEERRIKKTFQDVVNSMAIKV